MQAHYRLLLVLTLLALLLVACGSCSMSMSDGIIRGDFGGGVRGGSPSDDTTIATVEATAEADDYQLSLLEGQEGCSQVNCWAGIIPGVTTFEGARIRLLSLPDIAILNINRTHIDSQTIDWQMVETSTYLGGFLRSNQNGVVMDMTISFAENTLTVADLINWLGEPEYVWVGRLRSSELICAGSMMSFRDRGAIALLHPVADAVGVGIHPTQSIQILWILSLEDAASWFMYDYIQIEWQGYTDYCALAAEQLPTPISP